MAALVWGAVLAALGLWYVLVPLLRGAEGIRDPTVLPERPTETSALDVLREIEFDQATGKLSAEDYASLRATYTPRAMAELRARDGADAPDPAEQLIARMKSRRTVCSACGPRPEADALFCSDCGRYLAEVCLRCGAAVESEYGRFCGECGESLAT